MALFQPIDPARLVDQQFFAPETKFNVLGDIQQVIEEGRAGAADRQLQGAVTASVQGLATPDQIGLMFKNDPAKALKVLEGVGVRNQQQAGRVAQAAFNIRSAPIEQRPALIQQAAAQIQQIGGDPTRILSMLNMDEQQQNEFASVFEQASLSVTQRQEAGVAQQKLGLEERRTAATERNVASQIADRQRTQVRLAQKATNAANAGVQIDAKGRRSINGDVTGLIKESVAIQGAAESLGGLEKLGSAAARLAAVFKFMKALDPTSVVRESEQGQVYAASGAASQLAGQLNSILGQGKLTDAGFRDLVATSKNIANSSLSGATNSVNSYLETYEDTLPNSFKTRLVSRVPGLFEVPKAQQGAPDSTGTAQVSPVGDAVTVGRFSVTEFK